MKDFLMEKAAFLRNAVFVYAVFAFITGHFSIFEWSTSARVFAFLFWFFLMICWASRYYKDKINEQG